VGICSGRHERFDIVAKMMYLGDSSMDLRPESSRGRSRRMLGCVTTKLDGVIPPRRGANPVRFPRLWLKPAELKSPLINYRVLFLHHEMFGEEDQVSK